MPDQKTRLVWSTHVNRDGSIGQWQVSSPLIDGRGRASAATVGDYVFLVHGTTQVAPLR